MPPRLFRTSITLIRTSLVHLISFLLNSVSLQYPEQIFILAFTYISLYITPSPFSVYSENNILKQKQLPTFYLFILSLRFLQNSENSRHSVYLPSLNSEIFLSSPKHSETFLNLTQVEL